MKKLGLTVAFIAALPLFAAVGMFVKFDSVPGESVQPGHTGWFEISSFGWGASSAGSGPPCATAHTLGFTRKGPASDRLAQLCRQHAQMASMTVDVGGERHVLQNVSFAQCTSQPAAAGNAFESYTLSFGRCATHAKPRG